MNGSLIAINHDIIDKFRMWNTEKFREDAEYDKKITHALLVLCVGSATIASGQIPPKVLRFIHGEYFRNTTSTTDEITIQFSHFFYFTEILKVRVNCKPDRLNKLRGHVAKIVMETRKKKSN